MLFQGQEFAASSPFQYFADHQGELREAVREGRFQFLAQFPRLAAPEMRPQHPDPADLATFEQCKLDFTERDCARGGLPDAQGPAAHAARRCRVFERSARAGSMAPSSGMRRCCCATLAKAETTACCWSTSGADLRFDPAPEPLLAPPEGRVWRVEWSSEDPGLRRRGHGECGRRRRMADSRPCRHRHAACGAGGRMADLIRVLPRAIAPRSGLGSPPERGVAGHQRPGRLRLRHGERRHHAPLPRPADRRPAQSAGPHDDAQRTLRAPAPAGPQGVLHGRRGAGGDHAGAYPSLGRVSPGGRPAGVALRSGWIRSGKTPLPHLPAEHRAT